MIEESYKPKFYFENYTNNECSQSIIRNFTKSLFKIFVVNKFTEPDKLCIYIWCIF